MMPYDDIMDNLLSFIVFFFFLKHEGKAPRELGDGTGVASGVEKGMGQDCSFLGKGSL